MRALAKQLTKTKEAVADRPRRVGKGQVLAPLAIVAILAAALVTSSDRTPFSTPPQLTAAGEQVHYLPYDAQQFFDTLVSTYTTYGSQDIRLVSSIVSARGGNTVVIDHWEDGYDADPVNSPGSTTEVNTMAEGEVLVLQSVVDRTKIGQIDPDGNGQPYYDGRDKIVSTDPTVVTMGGWGESTGTVHAGATAVPEVSRYGYQFKSPVGEDAPYDPSADADDDSPWEYTGLIVQAAADDTTVTVAGGAPITLEEGELHLVDGGINLGDLISADKPISVYLATGDINHRYESRLYELTPTERWTDTYFTPVTSFNSTNLASRVFFYNPSSSAITVAYTQSDGTTGTVPVPAGGQGSYRMPTGQGARFTSTGNDFYALEVTTQPTASGTDDSAAYNWGIALIPAAYLTPMVVLGYAPGSANLAFNYSAAWVAPESGTTIYVDRDGDTTTGANTDPNGNKYDFTCTLDALEPVLITDDASTTCYTTATYTSAVSSGDGDMTGARIYTVDGTTLAAAWGQVPGLQSQDPAIDMGTTVLPFPTVDLTKTSDIVDDDGDGLADPGETIRYTISATNAGITPVDNLVLTDEIPAHTAYVEDSTIHNGDPVPDDVSGTPFPLDGSGTTLPPALSVGQTRTVTFDVVVDQPLDPSVTEIVNEATLQTSYGTYTGVDVQKTAPPEPSVSISKTVYAGDDGGASCEGGDLVYGVNGDTVTYCFTITNDGSTALSPVTFSDPDLGIDESDLSGPVGDLATLARDESVTLHYVTQLDGDLTNTASVTGTAVDGNGDPIPDVDPVTATDTAAVDEVTPALTVDKTIYRGHDGGALCAGGETAIGVNGDEVTYCFTITNTGDTHVGPVTLDDATLGIDEGDMSVVDGDPALLAPGDSVTFIYETTLDGDLQNTVTATGPPTDPNGDPLPGVDPVEDTDTADADEVTPQVSVAKTVYRGADGGAGCGTAGESVTGLNGDAVTYCFVVANDGDTELAPVTLTDGDLGVDGSDLTVVGPGSLDSLAAGQSMTLYLETALDGDLVNTAEVTGVPADGNGDPLPGIAVVEDNDTASVDSVGPAVLLNKSVYRGHDAGASCGAGGENLPALNGEAVTYCFGVTNSGDTVLAPVTVDDPDLGIDDTDMTVVGSGSLASLAAGETVVLYVETTVDGDLLNTATATGTPADAGGDPLPGLDPVDDDDTASVDEVAPGISVAKSVYRGHDSGAGCDTAGDLVRNVNGTPVTWCFVVSNDGDVPLNPVTVVDGDLGVDQDDLTLASGSINPLAPGDSATLYLEGTIDGDLPNTATVGGIPTDPGGTPLPGIDPPTDDDTAEVDEVGPAVAVAKTVYAGHDDGAGCPGNELQRGANGAALTYCFSITNTGDVTLTDVALDDGDLGIDQSEVTVLSGDLASLAPGDTVVAYIETVLDGDLVNTVTVSGTPVDGGGDPIDTDPPEATDTAEVEELTPSLAVAKSVYAGHSAGAGCEGEEKVVARSGDAVTYCFAVTNNGGATLAPVTVVDGDLGIDQDDMEIASGDPASVDPGDTVVLYFETTVGADLVNTATASGTPRDGDDPLPGAESPTDDDTAEVDAIDPTIAVDKTVYRGTDVGAGCGTAGDLVYGRSGDAVTYCFTVTNTGDTHLAPVTLDDADLGMADADMVLTSGSLDDLGPGDSAVLYVDSSIGGDLVNTVTAEGTPADAGGDSYPGLDPATASDTAEVREIDPQITVEKTVYDGQDDGAGCPGVESVAGVTGGDVTWCFTVTNTGDTRLATVELDDDLLGVDGTDVTLVGGGAMPTALDAGQSVTVYFEGVIDGNLENVAGVAGTPVDDADDPLPGVDPVTDDDTASVDDQAPSVSIDKGVYHGHDAGAECPGAGSVAVREGADITYCFTVTNDGESYLSPVTVVDPTLGLDDGDMIVVGNASLDLLAPGDSVTLYVETIAGPDDVTNTAFATGTPSDDQGDPLPGAQPVEDADTATVDVVNPSVVVAKTVYRGHDDGAGCGTAGELATGLDGDAVTYCFAVTNDGDTPLAPVTLLDGDLGITEAGVEVVGGGTLDAVAPGNTVVVYVEVTIGKDLVNTVSVSGTPVDGSGDPLPHVPNVSDEDTAEVDEAAPAISVVKGVYRGDDAGAGCDTAGDAVSALDGDAVSYCFLVTNEGDTDLAPVTLLDDDLGLDETEVSVVGGGDLADRLPLAPGDSVTLFIDTTVAGDLVNHVAVTGTPVDDQGDPYPGLDPVTDEDTAEVDEVAPALSVAKTVYRTHDDGAGCNGTDELAGLNGEDVTYCFAVTNAGDTPLVDVTFADPALGDLDETDLTVVGPGSLSRIDPDETVVLYFETTVDGDLLNTASVTGTPADGQGQPLPDLPAVTDDDTAEVFEVAPSVSIQKTVVRGHDTGADCPGSNLIAGEPGDAITYCFVVTNDGDTVLAPVDFSDPTLGLTGADVEVVGDGSLASLDPDESVTLYYETEVTGGDVLNTATVTGHPVDGQGGPLVGVENVTDSDDALVDSVGPAVTIAKTVYAGHSGGDACEGVELLRARAGDEVTYCFVVTNNGDTALAPVTVVDDDLGITDEDLDVVGPGSLSRLDPGDSVTLFVQTTVDGDLTNTAAATGTPVDDQGDPLGIRDVTDSDTAEVDEVEPSVSVAKTAYKGQDDGAGCTGAESVSAKAGGAVTYCFVVTNDGDTTLAPVTLDDADLNVDQTTMTVLDGDLSSLAPGDSVTLYVETTVDGDLTNQVTATGTPVDDTSTSLPGIDPVTDTDTASVDEIDPSMTLLTEVQDPFTGDWYDADGDGATLGSNDGVPATLRAGDTATFRFTVTNTGDAGITDVTVDAPGCDSAPTVISGDTLNAGVLDVGEVWVLTCNVSDVGAGFTMDASVTADSADGAPAGSGDHEVADVQVASIVVEKTVADPATGEFGDSATVEPGADVTFRIVVTNDGEVPLSDIVVTDELGPDCAREIGDVLEPGDSLAAYTCVVSDVEEGFVNTAVATATPVDDAGDPVGADVSDEDPATVNIEAPPVTDLAITKDLIDIDQDTAIATWQVTVTNVGDVAATEPIVVADDLGDGLSYRDAGGDGWLCEYAEPTVVCVTDIDLAPGGATSFTIETYVEADPDTTVTNVARVDGDDDTDGDNNTDDAAVVVDSQDDLVPYIPDTLPRTGSDIAGLVATGVLLVLAGFGLRRYSRRREA